jgi:hypothetical protein
MELGCSVMVGALVPEAITENPPVLSNVSVPPGVVKVTTASFVPTASAAGISKTAVTVYWLLCVMDDPLIVPMVALAAGTPAGGGAGVSESSVKVTVTDVAPCVAELGFTPVIWFAI